MRAATAVFIVCASLAATTALDSAQSQPTFRGGTDIVVADAVVVNGSGRQALGLTSADFKLSVDGQPRAIESVNYISARADAAGDRDRSGTTPAATSTDPTAPARHIVFVIDEGNIAAGRGRAALSATGRMLDALGPLDRVALISIPPGAAVDFTADREPIRAVLGRAVGRAPVMSSADDFRLDAIDLFAFEIGSSPGDRAVQESVILRECPETMPPARRELCIASLRAEVSTRLDTIRERTRRSLTMLETLVQSLAKMSGPKVIVMVSEGLIPNPDHRDEKSITAIASRAALADIRVFVMLLDGSLVDVADAGGRERTASSRVSADRSIEEDGLRALAAASGGVVIRITAGPDSAVDRLSSALSGYYVIGFRALPTDREGPHKISIAAVDSSLTVMARSQFAISPADRTATAGGGNPRVARPPARRGAVSSVNIDKVKLRVATRSVADAGGTIRILFSVDVQDPGAHPVTALALGYKLTSGDRVVSESGQVVPVTRNADGSTQPISYFAFRSLPPGRYSLQLSASDGTRHSGFVIHPVDAALHQVGPYVLGDLLLAASAPSEEGPYPVPADVVVGHRLVAGVEVTAADAAGLDATVRFEIVSNGAVQAAREVPLQKSGPPTQFVRSTVDFPQLPAGDFFVRASMVVGGGVVGAIDAPFRILR